MLDGRPYLYAMGAAGERGVDHVLTFYRVTASDSVNGYVVWGGPPEMGPIDGTVVPCAAGGSLPFLPRATLRVLKTIKNRNGDRA